jgi:hypothetical protein
LDAALAILTDEVFWFFVVVQGTVRIVSSNRLRTFPPVLLNSPEITLLGTTHYIIDK